MGFEIRVAFRVRSAVCRRAVLESIHLNIEIGLVAKEIENVRPDGMLATKLIIRETMVAKPGPHQALAPGLAPAQVASDAGCFGRLLQHERFEFLLRFSLTLTLSRWEREYLLVASNSSPRISANPAAGFALRRRMILPLPAGEIGRASCRERV